MNDDTFIATPPDKLILCDETGMRWAVMVRPDGQLQTAKYPDGDARTMQMWVNKAIVDAIDPPPTPVKPKKSRIQAAFDKIVGQSVADALESIAS